MLRLDGPPLPGSTALLTNSYGEVMAMLSRLTAIAVLALSVGLFLSSNGGCGNLQGYVPFPVHGRERWRVGEFRWQLYFV